MERVDIKKATKTNWNTAGNATGYPGDENMKIGCLQRIADATEAMAKNHIKLQQDLDMYIRSYNNEVEISRRLIRQNAALRGVITKLKNKTISQ